MKLVLTNYYSFEKPKPFRVSIKKRIFVSKLLKNLRLFLLFFKKKEKKRKRKSSSSKTGKNF